MAYPFSNNPLESYMKELRSLTVSKDWEFGNANNPGLPESVKKVALKRHNELSKKISGLKKITDIQGRTTDVFSSPPEIALALYDSDHPGPMDIYKCEHPEVEARLRTYTNNSTHVVIQCLVCGRPVRDLKKNAVTDWQNLPDFDESITQDKLDDCHRWSADRYGVYVKALREGDELPEFDYGGFREQYALEHNEPLTVHSCGHLRSENTLRMYESGARAVVLQCLDCGKHIKSVSSNSVSDISALHTFNEFLQRHNEQQYSEWLDNMIAAKKNAEQVFRENLNRELAEGKYSFKINSRFNTYYDSSEWRVTRERVLVRDNGECQACGKPAQCVHHISYDRLGAENDIDLMSLCNQCHDEVHVRQNMFSPVLKLTPLEILKLWEFGVEDCNVYFSCCEELIDYSSQLEL